MESTQHAKTFKSALHCAGDYGRIFKERFENKIMDLMNRLIGMIHTNIPREFKIDIIATIADFVLGLNLNVEAFVGELLNIADLSIGAVYSMASIYEFRCR
jgi:transcriptional regulator CtsR